MWRIVRSAFGLCLRAIRENPDKAAAVGVSARCYRLAAFVIAGVFGGVGGALLAVPTGLADPLLAYWTYSGNLVFMLLLGAFANFFGLILGAFVFIFLQDQVMSLTQYWRFIFGALLAIVVICFPRGLMGLFDSEGASAAPSDIHRQRGPHGPLRTSPVDTPAKPAHEPLPSRARPAGTRPRPLIEARDVVKLYRDVLALDGASLAVREGEFVSVIGPNGAGKTTLVHVLSGLGKPSSGRVTFKGVDVAGIGPVRLVRLGLARSFQLVNIFPGLTVAETLAVTVVSRLGRGRRLPASLARDAEVRAQAGDVAALFGFADRLSCLAGPLPQGDKKLLDVAGAFPLPPDVILLDE